VALIDVSVGHTMGLLALLSLGPAFAAVAGGIRLMIVVSGTALVLCGLLATHQDRFADLDEQLAFLAVLGVSVAGVLASSLRWRRERELAEARAVAEVAQRVLLRPLPARPGPVQLAVRYISASAGARIGGDLYEVVTTPDGTRLIVGDVQGKGLAAVTTAATVLAAFRQLGPDAPDLAAISAGIEAALARELADEEFVTAILAEVSLDGSKAELLNRGHPPPVVVDGAGPRLLDDAEGGLPIGLADLATPAGFRTVTEIGPGGGLLFYTDGVSEARNRAGDFFPLTAARALRAPGDPEQVLTALSSEVLRHAGHPLADDAAMLFVRRDPG
jgi:serine phosphatase RsbU (regulator of sigma subunit)